MPKGLVHWAQPFPAQHHLLPDAICGQAAPSGCVGEKGSAGPHGFKRAMAKVIGSFQTQQRSMQGQLGDGDLRRGLCPGCSGLSVEVDCPAPPEASQPRWDLRLKNLKLTWALYSPLLLIQMGFKSWPFSCQNVYNPLPFSDPTATSSVQKLVNFFTQYIDPASIAAFSGLSSTLQPGELSETI